MTGLFDNFFTYVNLKLGASGIFVICLSLLIVAFTITLILSLAVSGYGLKRRTWFLLFVLGVSGIEKAFSILCEHTEGYVILTFSLGLLLSIIVFSVKRGDKDKKQQLEFARFLDKQVAKQCVAPNNQRVENRETVAKKQTRIYDFDDDLLAENENLTKKPENGTINIDFTHVKNVIERLNYFPLNTTDRKLVKELENTVIKAESGECAPNTKNKINDGLGALLKIMSKYGV